MRLLILGATGPVGILLVRQAIESIPDVVTVLYVRTPEKVPSDLVSHPAVTIITGQLEDTDTLATAMEGVDAVLSALGPSVSRGPFHPSNTPIARGYSVVIDVMHQFGVKRLLCLGTASISDPADKFSLAFSALIQGVKTFARNAYNDVVAIGRTVQTKGEDLDWTIVRVPVLNDRDNLGVLAGYIGDGKIGTFLSRKGFAVFVIEELQKREWIQKRPMICSS